MNSPVSPQEWYEAGVLLRRQERFGEAINAFARAAELADEGISAIRASLTYGSASSDEMDDIIELERIRAASLAFIELIREINSFANTDLMNP